MITEIRTLEPAAAGYLDGCQLQKRPRRHWTFVGDLFHRLWLHAQLSEGRAFPQPDALWEVIQTLLGALAAARGELVPTDQVVKPTRHKRLLSIMDGGSPVTDPAQLGLLRYILDTKGSGWSEIVNELLERTGRRRWVHPTKYLEMSLSCLARAYEVWWWDNPGYHVRRLDRVEFWVDSDSPDSSRTPDWVGAAQSESLDLKTFLDQIPGQSWEPRKPTFYAPDVKEESAAALVAAYLGAPVRAVNFHITTSGCKLVPSQIQHSPQRKNLEVLQVRTVDLDINDDWVEIWREMAL